MGSTTSVEKQPPEEPPPLDVPMEPAHQEVAAAGLWQRMMEHAISAAATVPEFIEAPDDDSDGDGPVVTLLARAPTSLHLGVDADDAVEGGGAHWLTAMTSRSARSGGGAPSRRAAPSGATASAAAAERRVLRAGAARQRNLGPAVARAPVLRRRAVVVRGLAPQEEATRGVEDRGAVLRLRREPPRRRRPGPAAPHPRTWRPSCL